LKKLCRISRPLGQNEIPNRLGVITGTNNGSIKINTSIILTAYTTIITQRTSP
jgi:hypothetical protein